MTRPLADALLALPPADLAGALFPLFAQHVVQGFAPQIQAYRHANPARACWPACAAAEAHVPRTRERVCRV